MAMTFLLKMGLITFLKRKEPRSFFSKKKGGRRCFEDKRGTGSFFFRGKKGGNDILYVQKGRARTFFRQKEEAVTLFMKISAEVFPVYRNGIT